MSLLCTLQIADALAAVREHKKALTQAEKLEQEFIALMTGQTFSDKTSTSTSMVMIDFCIISYLKLCQSIYPQVHYVFSSSYRLLVHQVEVSEKYLEISSYSL